jgi:hypothetical protein
MPDYIPNTVPGAAPIASVETSTIETSTVESSRVTTVEGSGEIDLSNLNSLAGSLNHMAEVSEHNISSEDLARFDSENASNFIPPISETQTPVDDSTPSDAKDDEDLYSIKNFSI